MQNLLLSVLSSDRKKADIQCICNTTYAVRQWQWSVLGGVKWPMNSFTSVLDSWYLMDKSCLGCTWPGGSQGILVLINKRQHVFLFFDLLLKPTMFRKGFKNQCRNRFTFVLWAGLCRIPSGTWERWIRCPPPICEVVDGGKSELWPQRGGSLSWFPLALAVKGPAESCSRGSQAREVGGRWREWAPAELGGHIVLE
jgi:hypothetical protein